jgi:hypothetical protein
VNAILRTSKPPPSATRPPLRFGKPLFNGRSSLKPQAPIAQETRQKPGSGIAKSIAVRSGLHRQRSEFVLALAASARREPRNEEHCRTTLSLPIPMSIPNSCNCNRACWAAPPVYEEVIMKNTAALPASKTRVYAASPSGLKQVERNAPRWNRHA